MKQSLKYRFLEFVNRNGLLLPGQKVLAAVSGGIDSMVLLHLLKTWQQYFSLKIGVAHFNHQLRGESAAADAAFVKKIAQLHELPVFFGGGDVRGFAKKHKYSLEEAARELRENFLVECAEKNDFDVIATGHQLNDQAETLLMRMLSGTGIEGFAGIRLQRGKYVRPLLFAERKTIKAYAEAHKIEFRDDPSNEDILFDRNRIRHRLIPFLEKEFHLTNLQPFLRTGLIVQDWLSTINKQVAEVLENEMKMIGQNKIRLGIGTYKRYFSGIQIQIVNHILSQLTNKPGRMSFNRFQNFNQWVIKTSKGGKFLLSNQVIVERDNSDLVFKKQVRKPQVYRIFDELYPGTHFISPELNFELRISLFDSSPQIHHKPDIEFLDAENIKFPLILRNWRPGDRFQPLGMKHSKKISDFLTDEKSLFLPKKQMLVLESSGEIVYILKKRISERFKVTNQTGKVIKIETKIR